MVRGGLEAKKERNPQLPRRGQRAPACCHLSAGTPSSLARVREAPSLGRGSADVWRALEGGGEPNSTAEICFLRSSKEWQ